MSWVVVRGSENITVSNTVVKIAPHAIVDTHTSPMAALRACLILSAQDIRLGRVGDYRVEPPTSITLDEIQPPLPEWVLEILIAK